MYVRVCVYNCVCRHCVCVCSRINTQTYTHAYILLCIQITTYNKQDEMIFSGFVKKTVNISVLHVNMSTIEDVCIYVVFMTLQRRTSRVAPPICAINLRRKRGQVEKRNPKYKVGRNDFLYLFSKGFRFF